MTVGHPIAGNLLWQRRNFDVGAGVSSFQLDLQQTNKDITPSVLNSIMVIPLAPTDAWTDISVALSLSVDGHVVITFTNPNQESFVNALIWLPHTLVGPGAAEPMLGPGSPPLDEPPAPNGWLLWNRRRVVIPGLSTTPVASGIKHPRMNIDPNFADSIQVIVIPDTLPWNDIANGGGVTVGPPSPTGIVPFTNISKIDFPVNVLFWLPHTEVGPGDSLPYEPILEAPPNNG